MRTKQLSDLIEIAKCNSMSVAAKNTHTSRQALSNSLQSLEQELGCQLLDRSKKGVRLTNDGAKVLSAAQDIIARLDVLYSELYCSGTPQVKLHGKLDISISPMLNISVLPLAYADFRTAYPEVSIYTSEKYRSDAINHVSQDPESCSIVLVSKLLDDFFDNIPCNVELVELKTYPIYIAVSPRHPLANQKSVSLQSLAQYPVIVYEVGGATGVHALSKLSDRIQVGLSTNNPSIAMNYLDKDHAVMYSFPPYVQHNVFKDYRHIPLNVKKDENATLTVWVAVNRETPAQTRNIISLFVSTFAQYL